MSNRLVEANVPLLNAGDNVTSDESITVAGGPNGSLVAEKPFKTAIPQQAVTEERKPYAARPESALINAGTARANLAASREKPNGTTENNWAATHQHQTVSNPGHRHRFHIQSF